MVAPIIIPEPQFCDANGHPFAGGTITTYIKGTDTLKDCWVDPDQTSLQTNPIVLDAAGRCLMWGDGEYRLVLRDADGNLIWDQPSTTIVSAAMAPVVEAATIADAQNLLGMTDAIQTETDRATAAEATLQNKDTDLQNQITAEVNRATAAENAIQHQLGGGAFQSGFRSTNSSGYDGVTFPNAYTTLDNPFVMLQTWYGSLQSVSLVVETTPTGFQVWASDASGSPVAIGYMWISFGTYP